MKRLANAAASAILLLTLLPLGSRAAELLIPGGEVIGLRLRQDSVTVAAYDESLGAFAREAGLRIGDEIVTIDGHAICCPEDVRCALDRCAGAAQLTVVREGKTQELKIAPKVTPEGPRLGIYLRQGIAGIGTVTFYDPETHRFGSLGHGVGDSRGTLLEMTEGTAYEAEVESVVKGKSGQPGQLKGSAEPMEVCGTLQRNTPQGVFGISEEGWLGEPLPVAAFSEIRTGPATIRSTVRGDDVQEYSVEILKIYPQDRRDHRNFLLKVTDPALLAATGGIVQGMSGSPIIQDGKLVGAVTHVLVNDPTRGYGIFIENMLDAAE